MKIINFIVLSALAALLAVSACAQNESGPSPVITLSPDLAGNYTVNRSENISGPYPIVPVGANDSQTRRIVGEAQANISNRTYQEIQEAVDVARPGEENQTSEAAPGTVEEPRQGVPGFEATLAAAGILSALWASARRRH